MTTTVALSLLDGPADGMGEFARRQFGRVDLLNGDAALVDVRSQVDAQPVACASAAC